jgi:hypothetical protein
MLDFYIKICYSGSRQFIKYCDFSQLHLGYWGKEKIMAAANSGSVGRGKVFVPPSPATPVQKK